METKDKKQEPMEGGFPCWNWDTHAEIWHECYDCGVSLSDSKVNSDPTCPACGKVWSMS